MYNFPQATFDKVLSKEGVESEDEEEAEAEEEEEEEEELNQELEREFVADFEESDAEGDIEVRTCPRFVVLLVEALVNFGKAQTMTLNVKVMTYPVLGTRRAKIFPLRDRR